MTPEPMNPEPMNPEPMNPEPMNPEPMTEFEIVKETLSFYAKDPFRRAVVENTCACFYETADGRACAVGRCMTPEARERMRSVLMPISSVVSEMNLRMDDLLEPRYRGHGTQFWMHLQALHDCRDNWSIPDSYDADDERARRNRRTLVQSRFGFSESQMDELANLGLIAHRNP